VDKEDGCLVISGLRIVGAPSTSGGLSIFRPAKAGSSKEAGGAGSPTGAQLDALAAQAVAPAELFLAVHVPDLVSQVGGAQQHRQPPSWSKRDRVPKP
jgi:hypothetical protein